MGALLRKLQLWAWTYLVVLGLTLLASIIKRVRMSHDNGLIGSGRLKIVDSPAFPAHDFFQPGRSFDCRIRHAAVTYPDDAVLQVYAGSLKFADQPWESPLDLEMNTGTVSLFWSARSFLAFAQGMKEKGWVTYKDHYAQSPEVLRAARNSVRHVPSSYALLRYHSQTPTLFLATDGLKRYVKYRLLPEDSSQPDMGIASPERLEKVWDAQPPKDEIRDRNYLKDEYARRVTKGPVRYLLQLQLHTATDEDSQEIFNSNKEWDEATHPWMDLARVEITRAGTWEEAVLTRTSIGHAPRTLALIPARDVDDYNSLNYMRARTHLVKGMRIFMNKTFGIRPRPASRRIPGDNPWY